MSTTRPLRPTTRPFRTKKTCTDASSASSTIADDVEVLLLARPTICWRSMALRTEMSWSRRRAACSNSSVVARLVHLLVEPVEDGRGVAVEELDQLVDQAVVLVVVDGADARRRALLDVRVEARAAEALVAVELVLRARADRERAEQQVERLADRVRVRVRTEVADALALRAPQHHRPRPLLVEGDREVRVGLVVLVAGC